MRASKAVSPSLYHRLSPLVCQTRNYRIAPHFMVLAGLYIFRENFPGFSCRLFHSTNSCCHSHFSITLKHMLHPDSRRLQHFFQCPVHSPKNGETLAVAVASAVVGSCWGSSLSRLPSPHTTTIMT